MAFDCFDFAQGFCVPASRERAGFLRSTFSLASHPITRKPRVLGIVAWEEGRDSQQLPFML